MPRGNEIAVYSTYLKAQQAVDALSDEGFAVQTVTIVGHDLHMVERVTGRLTYPRVAAAGFASGAWFGLFVGLLLSLFGSDGQGTVILSGIVIGGGFGLLFSVLSYALTGGKRDFTSQSQIVAARYVLLCAPETAGKARSILADKGVQGDLPATVVGGIQPGHSATVVSRPPESTPSASGAHSAPASVPAGPPRTYGEMLDEQRRAAREAAQPTTVPASPTNTFDAPNPASVPASDGAPDDTEQVAEPTSTADAQLPSATAASIEDQPEASDADGLGTAGGKKLSNPDNPFSPPVD